MNMNEREKGAEKIYIYSDQGPLSHFPIQIQRKIRSGAARGIVRENEESKLLKGVGSVPVSAFIILDQRNQESKLLARSPVSDLMAAIHFNALLAYRRFLIFFPRQPEGDLLST